MCALLWPYLVPFPAQWDSPTCCSVCPMLRHIAYALGLSQGTSRTGCGVESKGKKGDETTDAEASVCICWQYAASPAAGIEMEMETRPVVSSALVKYLCWRGISDGYQIAHPSILPSLLQICTQFCALLQGLCLQEEL